jgi:ParB family chromosome partitioning protein
MKPGEVTYIPVKNIERNPHNPRRLFDEEPMRILQESIKQVGVLVPITVYPKEDKEEVDATSDTFVLLDGERRWRCVVNLGKEKIPAIIVEKPTEVTNILTMFHIHNMREAWMLMPTALKLQTLIEKLGEENETKLAELTKLSISQIRRCKILLTFPEKHQNLLLAPPIERIKADFFIELQRIRGPALSENMPFWISRGDEKCIDIMLHKYLDKNKEGKSAITAVTQFRKLVEIYRGSIRTNQVERFYDEMERFLNTPTMEIEDLNVPGASFEKDYKEITRSAKRLHRQLLALDRDAVSGDQKMINILVKLSDLIKAKLEEALVVRAKRARTKSY